MVTTTAKLIGTDPATGRTKRARGTGTVVRRYAEGEYGFYGPVQVVRWSNGVETCHARDLDNSNVLGLGEW